MFAQLMILAGVFSMGLAEQPVGMKRPMRDDRIMQDEVLTTCITGTFGACEQGFVCQKVNADDKLGAPGACVRADS